MYSYEIWITKCLGSFGRKSKPEDKERQEGWKCFLLSTVSSIKLLSYEVKFGKNTPTIIYDGLTIWECLELFCFHPLLQKQAPLYISHIWKTFRAFNDLKAVETSNFTFCGFNMSWRMTFSLDGHLKRSNHDETLSCLFQGSCLIVGEHGM